VLFLSSTCETFMYASLVPLMYSPPADLHAMLMCLASLVPDVLPLHKVRYSSELSPQSTLCLDSRCRTLFHAQHDP
jgi:hypothetical protein